MTRRRILLLILALVAVAAVVAGLFVAIGPQQKAAIPNAVRQQLQQTQIGKTSEAIMKPGHAITTMVGPGTEAWWKVETNFVQAWGLQGRWGDLPAKPETVGFTLFYAPETPDQRFATQAIFLSYDSATNAQKAVVSFNKGKLSSEGSQYQSLRLGKTAVVVPTAVYTDQVFNNTLNFKAPSGVTNVLTEGYWQVNAKALDSYVKRNQKDADRNVYLKAVQALGFNTDVDGVWYGRSKDGLNWQGRLSVAQGPGAAWSAKAVNPTKFYSVLAATAKRIGAPSQSDFEEAQKAAKDPNYVPTYFFTVIPRQSVLTSYFAIATGGKVKGSVSDLRSGDPQKAKVAVKAPKDQNKVIYVLDPNVWLNTFMNPDSGDLWYLFNYKKATLTFYKNDPTRLDVGLTAAS